MGSTTGGRVVDAVAAGAVVDAMSPGEGAGRSHATATSRRKGARVWRHSESLKATESTPTSVALRHWQGVPPIVFTQVDAEHRSGHELQSRHVQLVAGPPPAGALQIPSQQ
jgi:hypothetical protein